MKLPENHITLAAVQTIKDISFLKKSDKKELDDLSKEIISNTKFIKTANDMQMRFIFVYDFIDKKNLCVVTLPQKQEIEQKEKPSDSSNYQDISRGITRFESSKQEDIRVFETNENGLLHVSTTPALCATLQVLTSKNERVLAGVMPWNINGKIAKGKYKLLVKAREDCDIDIQYP